MYFVSSGNSAVASFGFLHISFNLEGLHFNTTIVYLIFQNFGSALILDLCPRKVRFFSIYDDSKPLPFSEFSWRADIIIGYSFSPILRYRIAHTSGTKHCVLGENLLFDKIFCGKLHENERIWTERWERHQRPQLYPFTTEL